MTNIEFLVKAAKRTFKAISKMNGTTKATNELVHARNELWMAIKEMEEESKMSATETLRKKIDDGTLIQAKGGN